MPIPSEQILDKLKNLLEGLNSSGAIDIKIFNSGSFFDDKDVPQSLRAKILALFKQYSSIRKLSVESRPEYLITNIRDIIDFKKELSPIILEIGIGLESSNNNILKDCWNKGFFLEDYENSVKKIRKIGIRVKTYILIKPPFLTESEAINDAIKTIKAAYKIGTDIISLNPCNVQNGTLVHYLYKKDLYQPPWLWSVLFILQTTKRLFPLLEIICEPSAGGKQRGTHNCGKCDKLVLDLIKKTVNNEVISSSFDEICTCSYKWKLLVESPIETFRLRNLSKLRKLDPLNE